MTQKRNKNESAHLEFTEKEKEALARLERTLEAEKRFYVRIGERAKLWREIISSSQFHGGNAIEIENIVDRLENSRFGDALNLHGAIADAVDQLINVNLRAATVFRSNPDLRDKTQALAEKLVEDINAFYKELTSE